LPQDKKKWPDVKNRVINIPVPQNEETTFKRFRKCKLLDEGSVPEVY
jgi:hypothetical protein